MSESQQPIYLAGEWVTSSKPLKIINPYDGSIVATTFHATPDLIERAIAATAAAAPVAAELATYERARLLNQIRDGMVARRQELIETIVKESGKPIGDATVEVDRGIFTMETAAEEAKRINGEAIPLDLMPSSRGRFGIVRRFPIGPVLGISPFNFPLNLALHKLGPALAAGCPILIKPPSRCPLTMLLVAEIADEAGVPKGMLSVLPCDRGTGDLLVEDDRFKLLSFTGSPDVGWQMKARASKKKVVLELGGNAGVIVDDDADLDLAVQRITYGAFAYAGQVCISVQRVFIHRSIYDTVRDRLVEAAQQVKMGDPMDPATKLGPMIDEKAAARAEQWIEEARRQGARILCGGRAEGRFMPPTVIENAPPDSFVCSREAFAPLVTLAPFERFAEALTAVNDSAYGLQAGVFTNRLEHALAAHDRLEVGGVIINDIPTYRIDHMPYGGVKDSGLGREGVRYSVEDMTEPRLLVFNRPESQRVG